RQNPVRLRLGARRRHVFQERGQSAGRADVDVSASAVSLQLRYGFAESNRAPHDIPEKVVREGGQNSRLIAAGQRQSALLAPDRSHERLERGFRLVYPPRMKGERNREPLIAYVALHQGLLDLREFRPSCGYYKMRGKVDCRQFAVAAEEILR